MSCLKVGLMGLQQGGAKDMPKFKGTIDYIDSIMREQEEIDNIRVLSNTDNSFTSQQEINETKGTKESNETKEGINVRCRSVVIDLEDGIVIKPTNSLTGTQSGSISYKEEQRRKLAARLQELDNEILDLRKSINGWNYADIEIGDAYYIAESDGSITKGEYSKKEWNEKKYLGLMKRCRIFKTSKGAEKQDKLDTLRRRIEHFKDFADDVYRTDKGNYIIQYNTETQALEVQELADNIKPVGLSFEYRGLAHATIVIFEKEILKLMV